MTSRYRPRSPSATLPGRALASLSLAAGLLLLSAASLRADTNSTAPAPAAPAGKVNINTASVGQIAILPRIGEKVAERIVELPEGAGPFAKPEDLMEVKGIGEKLFLTLKPYSPCPAPPLSPPRFAWALPASGPRFLSRRRPPRSPPDFRPRGQGTVTILPARDRASGPGLSPRRGNVLGGADRHARRRGHAARGHGQRRVSASGGRSRSGPRPRSSTAFFRARAYAISRGRHVGLKFRRNGDRYEWALYGDGNGNGVRTAEIASGVDRSLGVCLPWSRNDVRPAIHDRHAGPGSVRSRHATRPHRRPDPLQQLRHLLLLSDRGEHARFRLPLGRGATGWRSCGSSAGPRRSGPSTTAGEKETGSSDRANSTSRAKAERPTRSLRRLAQRRAFVDSAAPAGSVRGRDAVREARAPAPTSAAVPDDRRRINRARPDLAEPRTLETRRARESGPGRGPAMARRTLRLRRKGTAARERFERRAEEIARAAEIREGAVVEEPADLLRPSSRIGCQRSATSERSPGGMRGRSARRENAHARVEERPGTSTPNAVMRSPSA